MWCGGIYGVNFCNHLGYWTESKISCKTSQKDVWSQHGKQYETANVENICGNGIWHKLCNLRLQWSCVSWYAASKLFLMVLQAVMTGNTLPDDLDLLDLVLVRPRPGYVIINGNRHLAEPTTTTRRPDFCLRHRCQHRGVCQETFDGYICDCNLTSWAGTYCQDGRRQLSIHAGYNNFSESSE